MASSWRLGTFETVFPRGNLAESLIAVKHGGFSSVQFDFLSAGIDHWNHTILLRDVVVIRDAASKAGIAIPAVSGTYNIAHPDRKHREKGHIGLLRVLEAVPSLDAAFVTLCTGTRSTISMWQGHPDNDSVEAWADAREAILAALPTAETNGITLLIEPEPANIVGNAHLARRMLDEVNHPSLRIVLDPANIVLSDRERSPSSVLAEAFDILGPDIVFAHAKDLNAAGEFCAAGTGTVPWDLYQDLLRDLGYAGDVVFHTLTEQDVPRAIALFDD
jgi:sugar phosphate isomerase/epimerase